MSNQSGSLGSQPFYIKYNNTNMLEKTFKNKDLGIELTSYIDDQQNVWFLGKDVAEILGYKDTNQAIRKHVDTEDQKSFPVKTTGQVKSCPVKTTGQVRWCIFINESGFYSLLLSSKLESAKKFKRWVTSQVLPAIRKYGQYKLFDSPWNKMIMIGNETDLHYKVVQLIRRYYPDSILVAVLVKIKILRKRDWIRIRKVIRAGPQI